MKMMTAAFLAGAVFSLGLILSGMIDPANVLGFLDILGAWNPSLAFVMAGGLLVTVIGYRRVLRRDAPCFAEHFQVPTAKTIDAKLVIGSALFGLGWGIGGYCPGPGLAAAASGSMDAVVFVAAMLAGMLVWRGISRFLP